jgi:CBS domain containing-hemolysin-like protein
LILAHAAFVAGEFGLVAVDRASVEQLAREGNRRAQGTLAALQGLSFQLSGAQLGITVTSLLVGFLTEPAIAPLIRPALEAVGFPEGTTVGVSITIALLLATAFEMVVAELIPKNLAIARPTGMALATANPLRWTNALWRPLIVFLNASANWTVRRMGIEPREELIRARSLQELELLIYSSREAGALLEEEFALLSRSISFAEKTAADALVPRTSVLALHESETLGDLARLALESGHSRFPVYGADIDDIVGIAHVKDIHRFPHHERSGVSVGRILRPALAVPESRDLESLLLQMRRERKQLAIVVDEYGGTEGILTLEDLLEEIVGEIEDEHDPAAGPRMTSAVPEGVSIVSGRLHPTEVRDACGFDIPDGPYETLAGFLLWLFDRIPEQGDHVSYDGWEFKVVAMEKRRIEKVLVVKANESGSESRA